VAAAGVDALIVQDLGAVELIRRVAPGLPIHGSTQMSITSAQGAQVVSLSPPCSTPSLLFLTRLAMKAHCFESA